MDWIGSEEPGSPDPNAAGWRSFSSDCRFWPVPLLRCVASRKKKKCPESFVSTSLLEGPVSIFQLTNVKAGRPPQRPRNHLNFHYKWRGVSVEVFFFQLISIVWRNNVNIIFKMCSYFTSVPDICAGAQNIGVGQPGTQLTLFSAQDTIAPLHYFSK